MRLHQATIAAVVTTASLLFTSHGLAQNAPFAALPGLSETQRATAAGIQTVCERLAANPVLRPTGTPQEDLFLRCREMVQTSNQLQGSGPTEFSLRLPALELGEVLSRVAPDEVPAAGALAVQQGAQQFRLLAPRLAALRRGAGGLSLNLDLAGKKLAASGADILNDASGAASPDLGRTGRLGLFLNGNVAFGDKDTTPREVGFDFNSWGLLGGVDYRLTDNLVLGVALNYTFTDADFERGQGEVDAHSYGGLVYGTYYRGALYVDAHGGFNWNRYDITRNITYPNPFVPGGVISRRAKADTDGQQYTVGIGTGYDIRTGPVTITPFARLEYIRLDVDGYSERGAAGLDLRVRDQDVDSFQSTLGVTLSYAWSLPFGVLVPQVRGEWRHEFLNDERAISAKYVHDPGSTVFAIPTDRPDRDFFALSAGLSAVLARGISAFVNYETILGLRDVTHHEFWWGVRVEF